MYIYLLAALHYLRGFSMKNTSNIKRTLIGTAAVVISITTLSSCKDSKANSNDVSLDTDQGKVLNIYCENLEFQETFAMYYIPHANRKVLEDVEMNWILPESEDETHLSVLNKSIENQNDLPTDEKIDLFIVDMDKVEKLVNSDVAVPVSELGITEDDLKNQYDYTKQVFTNQRGELIGVTWEATPGLYFYRVDIAEAVLGTSDPDEVQAYISDLDKFTDLAAKMKENGYRILSGYDDMYELFSSNMTAPWVTDGKITIDEKLKQWIDLTKKYTDNGYNNNTSLGDDSWFDDMNKTSNVFGYFFSTWGSNFPLPDATVDEKIRSDGSNAIAGNGLYGQWRACTGPVPYVFGGTGLIACQGTDNQELIKDIMLNLTCNTEAMKAMTENGHCFSNNKEANRQLIDSGYENTFLGGQNHLSLLDATADKISFNGNLSAYDQYLSKKLKSNMMLYFNGSKTYDEALDSFYSDINEIYPVLPHK